MRKYIILIFFVFGVNHVAYSQQLTKELIIPNNYEENKLNNTYFALPAMNLQYFNIDDSTFLLITHYADKLTSLNPERIQPVFYKIKNTEKGFEILWKSKPYLDTSFTAYFGDLVVEDGKYKTIFLYQKSKYSRKTNNCLFYPFFMDTDADTGEMIDSLGCLGDFKTDSNDPNSTICYIAPINKYNSRMKYDGKDLIVPVKQTVNDTISQFIKNISRNGVINSVFQLPGHLDATPIMFIKNKNSIFRYKNLILSDSIGPLGQDHLASYYLNNELEWCDTLAYTQISEDKLNPTGSLLSGSGFINNDFCMFISQRDYSRNFDKVFSGIYNDIGRLKADTILTNDVNFSREFATLDNEDNYYFAGFNNSLYPLISFQVEQYKNTQKKSFIWKKDSIGKNILGVCPMKNDKAIALGMIYDQKKLIRSFYIAEIDFSKPNGVTQEPENLNLSISPNPAGDFIHISNINYGENIEIYNLLGIKQFGTNYKGQIDISNLPIGVYYLKVGNQTAKFVKL